MCANVIQAKTFQLQAPIGSTDTTIAVKNLETIYGDDVEMSGSIQYATLEPESQSNQEIISFTGITLVSANIWNLTGVTRGLDAQPTNGIYGNDPAQGKAHASSVDCILSDSPQVWDDKASKSEDEEVTGAWTFDISPIVPTPDSTFEAANKDYVDNSVAAGASDSTTTTIGISRQSYSPTVTIGTATMTIASPCVVTFTSHGLTLNDSIQFTTTGALPTGLLPSTTYYVISAGLTANTFQLATTRGGTAINTTGSQSGTHTLYKTTPIVWNKNDPAVMTQTKYQAGAELYGTDAGGDDTYVVTLSPVLSAYTTGMVLRAKMTTANTGACTIDFGPGVKSVKLQDGTDPLDGMVGTGIHEYIYDGTNLVLQNPIIINSERQQTYTASGAIEAMDTVYVSAADTVKTLYPSAMGTGAAISTAPTAVFGCRNLPLSTNGLFLHITGGTGSPSRALTAQVRTMNAAETDFSNGSAATVYNTSNGVNWYDVCSIGTDKFLFVFQADTGGAGAGIKVCVATISGTTVTVGAITTIETTGTISVGVDGACCKLDTDKGIIFYRKDSDTFMYAQVLSVSGTTITTNTPYQVKGSAQQNLVACQLGTNSACIIYNTMNVMYGRTISVSGTVVTTNAENTFGTDATGGSWCFGLMTISSTKVLVAYGKVGGGTRTKVANIGISGTTLTLSSTINVSNTAETLYFGMVAIGTKYALFLDFASATSGGLFFLDVSGTAPTQISTQSLANTTNSNLELGYSVVKVAPWTYVTQNGGAADGDYIVKLTPVSTARIGVAESAISDTATGAITIRHQLAVLSGLTAGSIYYVDDNGQPTTGSSLTAPTLGIAISTNSLLLQ